MWHKNLHGSVPKKLKPGDHVCLLWQTEEEHRAAVAQFLIEGLQRGEKVIYFIHTHQPSIIVDYLHGAGADVGRYLVSGQLSTLDAESVYLKARGFDADRVLGLLQAETGRALRDGYAALRVTGEMTWSLHGLPGSERLFEYESRLNAWFPQSGCIGLCQYSCEKFSPAMLWHAAVTHPAVVINSGRYHNRFYVSPSTYLDPVRREAFMQAQLDQDADPAFSVSRLPDHYRDIELLLQEK